MFLAQSSQIPCNFLSEKSTWSIFCFNEVTLGGLLVGSWMRLVTQKNQTLPAPSSREGRGAMALLTDHAYMRSLHKIPVVWGSGSFQAGQHTYSHGDRSSWAQDPPGLALCTSSSGWSPLSFITAFNKLLQVPPWVLCAALANLVPHIPLRGKFYTLT